MGADSTGVDTSKLSGAIRAKRGPRSLRDVEDEAGIPHATLGRIERGQAPDLKNFIRICDWIGVPTDYFLAKRQPA